MRPLNLLVGMLVFGSALAACGEDDGSAVASTTTTVAAVDEAPTCEEWMSRPVTVADDVEHGCSEPLDSGVDGYVQSGMAAFECDDGRTLFWGDAGWGYVGEPMRPLPGSDFVAPQAERDACGVPPMPPMPPPPPLPE
jgi:hypothetical protein